MSTGRRARLVGERYTHQQLWRTAQWFRREGLAKKEGSFYPLLAATIFAATAFEALLNELLRTITPDVYADERQFFARGAYRGTLGKFHYIADAVGLSVDRSRRPYQSVAGLQVARDRLVHARTELFDRMVPVEDVHRLSREASDLDGYASAPFVERTLDDLEALCDALVRAARDRFGSISVGSDAGAFSGIDGAWYAAVEQDGSG